MTTAFQQYLDERRNSLAENLRSRTPLEISSEVKSIFDLGPGKCFQSSLSISRLNFGPLSDFLTQSADYMVFGGILTSLLEEIGGMANRFGGEVLEFDSEGSTIVFGLKNSENAVLDSVKFGLGAIYIFEEIVIPTLKAAGIKHVNLLQPRAGLAVGRTYLERTYTNAGLQTIIFGEAYDLAKKLAKIAKQKEIAFAGAMAETISKNKVTYVRISAPTKDGWPENTALVKMHDWRSDSMKEFLSKL